jgi:hypothetical protein
MASPCDGELNMALKGFVIFQGCYGYQGKAFGVQRGANTQTPMPVVQPGDVLINICRIDSNDVMGADVTDWFSDRVVAADYSIMQRDMSEVFPDVPEPENNLDFNGIRLLALVTTDGTI